MALPNIPQIPSTVDSKVRQAFNELRAWFGSMGSQGGIPSVTDIVTGTVPAGATTPSAGGSTGGSSEVPLSPGNLTVTGGIESILVSWDRPSNSLSVSVYQVWRSTDTIITNAILLGSTISTLFSDTPPLSADPGHPTNYYYWVRGMNTSGEPGAWTDIAGVLGHTEQISSNHIKELVVDRLKVTGFTPVQVISILTNTAMITDACIANEIKSIGFSPGSAGWRIQKDGTIEGHNVYLTGEIQANSLKANEANIVSTIHLSNRSITLPLAREVAYTVNGTTSGSWLDVPNCFLAINAYDDLGEPFPVMLFQESFNATTGLPSPGISTRIVRSYPNSVVDNSNTNNTTTTYAQDDYIEARGVEWVDLQGYGTWDSSPRMVRALKAVPSGTPFREFKEDFVFGGYSFKRYVVNSEYFVDIGGVSTFLRSIDMHTPSGVPVQYQLQYLSDQIDTINVTFYLGIMGCKR